MLGDAIASKNVHYPTRYYSTTQLLSSLPYSTLPEIEKKHYPLGPVSGMSKANRSNVTEASHVRTKLITRGQADIRNFRQNRRIAQKIKTTIIVRVNFFVPK